MGVYRREYVSIIAACGVGFPAVRGFLMRGFCRGVGGKRVRLGRMVVLLLMLLLLLLLRFLLLFLLLLFPALPSLLFLANLHELQPSLLMTDEHFMDKRDGRKKGEKVTKKDLKRIREFVLTEKGDVFIVLVRVKIQSGAHVRERERHRKRERERALTKNRISKLRDSLLIFHTSSYHPSHIHTNKTLSLSYISV